MKMEQMSLFDDNRITYDPLASRLRPSGLDEFVGQKHLIGEGKVLRRLIVQDMVSSMIFWGPPGVWERRLWQGLSQERQRLNLLISAR